MTRDIRPDGAWYAVYLTDRRPIPKRGEQRATVVSLPALRDALPHGSGLDTDWHVTILRNGDIRLDTEYHSMSEHGYYNGWRKVRFTVRRERKSTLNFLIGPCAGYAQTYPDINDVTLTTHVRGDLGDYLHDVMSEALRPMLRTTSHVIPVPVVGPVALSLQKRN